MQKLVLHLMMAILSMIKGIIPWKFKKKKIKDVLFREVLDCVLSCMSLVFWLSITVAYRTMKKLKNQISIVLDKPQAKATKYYYILKEIKQKICADGFLIRQGKRDISF